MAKRLALCFDGTWNTPDKAVDPEAIGPMDQADEPPGAEAVSGRETNVVKLCRSILPKSHDGWVQQKWYDRGVGTEWYRRFRGGALGRGLDKNILQGYTYLVATHDDGDAVYIYGFSRGAYTARSLVGLIRNCGLLRRERITRGDLTALRDAVDQQSSAEVWHPDVEKRLNAIIRSPDNPLIDEAYRLYRERDGGADTDQAVAFRRRHARDIPIKCLGVWDTVGALGIPLGAFRWMNEHRYRFHDTELSRIVEHAYHAVAIDEHRKEYAVALWTSPPKPGQTVEQRWFPGAHADVGGGYPERELADITLAWMQQKSEDAGLAIDPAAAPAILDPLGTLHDSFAEFLGGFWKWFRRRFYRKVRHTGLASETIDDSVRARVRRDSAYRPKNAGLEGMLRPPIGGDSTAPASSAGLAGS